MSETPHPSPTPPEAGSPTRLEMTAELRRWRVGVLQADGELEPAKFVASPIDGKLLLPVSRDAAGAEELVLWIPEESYSAMQALLEPRELLDEDWDAALEGARDRYLAYHGAAKSTHWQLCGADSFKWRDEVYTGDEILRPSELRRVESRLLKRINAERHAGALAKRFAHATVSEAIAVGVDELGVDVRSRVGVLRIAFDEPLAPDDAEATIDRMIAETSGD